MSPPAPFVAGDLVRVKHRHGVHKLVNRVPGGWWVEAPQKHMVPVKDELIRKAES